MILRNTIGQVGQVILMLLYGCHYAYLSSAKTVNNDQLSMALPEPRAYLPDAQNLDFVYHDHEELTRFLRYVNPSTHQPINLSTHQAINPAKHNSHIKILSTGKSFFYLYCYSKCYYFVTVYVP